MLLTECRSCFEKIKYGAKNERQRQFPPNTHTRASSVCMCRSVCLQLEKPHFSHLFISFIYLLCVQFSTRHVNQLKLCLKYLISTSFFSLWLLTKCVPFKMLACWKIGGCVCVCTGRVRWSSKLRVILHLQRMKNNQITPNIFALARHSFSSAQKYTGNNIVTINLSNLVARICLHFYLIFLHNNFLHRFLVLVLVHMV